MFSTLESTWNKSAHRRWTALVSFTVQAFGLSLLLLIPLLTIQSPPKVQWLEAPIFTPPAAPAPAAQQPRPISSSNIASMNIHEAPVQPPPAIRGTVADLNEPHVASAPNLDNIAATGGTNLRGRGITGSIGPGVDVAALSPTPAPAHPLKLSHWAEGNLIYRVQPSYPPLAREARVQGTVELRAIISKAGTIENLVVIRGHPMLSAAAIAAVRQWRYRPYLLNNEPIEVETEITVNFLLSGN
ncbi:MAG: energy transducer TonB [Terriglobales bacterium]